MANFTEKTYSVSQITDVIKQTIEHNFSEISIQGEISNFRPSSTGHWYFTLKDEGAAIAAVMFKRRIGDVSFTPRDGMLVKVTGSLSVYAAKGSYQIIAESMEAAGTGDILLIIEERKRKLAAEGLFDEENKQPLPQYPATVGVITSPTGAALQDIINITRRRNSSVNLVILPCAVQGESAAQTIAKQIQTANDFNMADVLIVGRGGGSLEDLLPFSEECVVRAVAASKIPIVSAVGHEIDYALSDFAADLRAPTPSAAAELVTPLKTEIFELLENFAGEMEDNLLNRIERYRMLLNTFSVKNMELCLRSIQTPLLQRFDSAKDDLALAMTQRIEQTKNRLALAKSRLEDAHPQKILNRGFSIVRKASDNSLVCNANQVQNGEELIIQSAKGSIGATVNVVTP